MAHLSFKEKKNILFSGAGFKVLIISWLAMLLFFNWLFSDAHIEGLKLSFGSKKIVKGYITDLEFTNVTTNDVPIYQFYYSYAVDGEFFMGTSYDGGYYDIDDEVNVEYLKGNQSLSRIQESDKTLSGPVFTTIVFLIFAGLSFWLYSSVRKRIFKVSIVSNGIVAGATLADKVMTNTTINDRALFKLYYKYEADRQKYQVVESTTYPDEFRDNQRVVYHRNKPSKGILLSQLPNDVQRRLIKSQ